MTDLLVLGPDEIRKKALELLGPSAARKGAGRPRFLAVYGTGSEDVIPVEELGELRIQPVRS
jgi:hypothetical protein